MTKIFSDYAKYYNLIYSTKNYKSEAEFVFNWANKPKTIIEIGCGTGRHIYHLAPKVEQIIGTDASLEMLSLAYIHTKKFKNVRYIFNKTDKKLLDLPKVDCAMALFNVMGYCFLEECLPHLPLKRGGYFIFDIWDASKFKQYPPVPKVKYFGLAYRVAIPKQISKRLLRIDYIIVEGKEVKVFERHFVQGYFQKDIEQLCKLHNYKISDIKPTKEWTCWYKLQKL